jgi:maltose alpha-D-glucosyltransferase / alpha-amylase
MSNSDWYKDAVIYELHVRAFFDSNDDGVGDFRGLLQKLDYLQDLGVNTLWLLPFYPSPGKDDGYDIADYRKINPRYGTTEDLRELISELHRRDMRLITELVINHTSDQHPWFQAARRAPRDSRKHNYYVWSDQPDRYLDTRIIFSDTESSNWAFDSVAGRYYWHRFFSHQPDLNFDNPHVERAVTKVMRYWLDQGVDGLRLDAIPYLVEREGTSNDNLRETHEVVKRIRRVIDTHYGDRVLLGEANMWPEYVRDFFGDGDECHMAFHFPLMPRMYMAIAQEDRHPIVEILQQTPELPSQCQWAIFLRNHDELTLEVVTDRERDYMYQMYAQDAQARLNLGIRRRLAPLMENDPERIKLMNSFLLSMPGSPVIYYGDEIGMGDNVYLGDRNGMRTPMQWNSDRNGGFSRAEPQSLTLPAITDPVYGYQVVNVAAQTHDRSSLLNWTKRMLQVRKTSTAFGRGTLQLIRPANRKILAYLREHGEDVLLCVANLSRHAQPVELDLSAFKGRVPVELLGRTAFTPISDTPYYLTLTGYGFYWFKLSHDSAPPVWYRDTQTHEELPVLVLGDGWRSFAMQQTASWRDTAAAKLRSDLEAQILPHILAKRTGYDTSEIATLKIRLTDHGEVQTADNIWFISIFTTIGTADAHLYCLPLAKVAEDQGSAIARVRERATLGWLIDAWQDDAFRRSLLAQLESNSTVTLAHGQLNFIHHGTASDLAPESCYIKPYFKLGNSVDAELELSKALHDAGNTAPVASFIGHIEYRANSSHNHCLAVIHTLVSNQGSAWDYTIDYLMRFIETDSAEHGSITDIHGGYLELIRVLAKRLAELHVALAGLQSSPALTAEKITKNDIQQWHHSIHAELLDTLQTVAKSKNKLPEIMHAAANLLIAQREQLVAELDSDSRAAIGSLKCRIHGDFHLGRALLCRNDFTIINFSGESNRSAAERRAKYSPAKDLAAMLRSFAYARALAEKRATESLSRPESKKIQLASWERQVRETFLASYHQAAQGTGLYRSFDAVTALLPLFEMQRACYELRCELLHRRRWGEIALRALLGQR